ncbi:helix-turn-helix transcriptional regulator [Amycolatopsis albispora]|uniref:Transcriptional regulator n=1 Tax=Amycolatopsis albispora TaxID=1804986 RepID=A0A344LCH2_9PSEU|nr:WYL domain-containing protein [Amycolatopsis albispora]AXB45746.1 transcriptional regulator [Amycolatopsis albispora]
MRAERLVALLFTLQRKRGATAAELAAELGVSERTMHRDLAALRDAGVPLWTETGRNGGVRLVDGWRARLDGLTSREAVAIFAFGVPEALGALGLGTAVSAAHAKVSASLPKELREQAEHVAGRFHLDAPGWFRGEDSAGSLATVTRAVWESRRLRVSYRRRDKIAERLLEPLGLVLKAGVWYLVARVPEDDALRTYRVGRISEAELLDERFTRPEGFDLAGWWRESSAAFEQFTMRIEVRLRLSPRAFRQLPRVLGPEAMPSALLERHDLPDGWIEARLAMETEEIAIGQLTSLGGDVEVLSPESIRAGLAAIGAEMAARNAPLD